MASMAPQTCPAPASSTPALVASAFPFAYTKWSQRLWATAMASSHSALLTSPAALLLPARQDGGGLEEGVLCGVHCVSFGVRLEGVGEGEGFLSEVGK